MINSLLHMGLALRCRQLAASATASRSMATPATQRWRGCAASWTHTGTRCPQSGCRALRCLRPSSMLRLRYAPCWQQCVVRFFGGRALTLHRWLNPACVCQPCPGVGFLLHRITSMFRNSISSPLFADCLPAVLAPQVLCAADFDRRVSRKKCRGDLPPKLAHPAVLLSKFDACILFCLRTPL